MSQYEIDRTNGETGDMNLSVLEKDILHLCAVIYEPTTLPIVYKCFRHTRLANRYPDIVSPKSLETVFQKLQSLNLLTDRYQCHPAIMETAIRRAAKTVEEGYFQDIIQAVQEVLSFSDTYRYSAGSEEHRDRLMRDFRIGIYTVNAAQIRECHRQLVSHDATEADFTDPFAFVFLNPFDRNWFARLPIEIQITGLNAMYSHAISSLNSDMDALSYGSSTEFLDLVPDSEWIDYLSHLIPRLLLGGQVAHTRQILSETETSPLLGGFSGWAFLLQGQADLAVQSFEEYLALLRKRSRNRSEYFKGFPGIFHVLALLKQAEQDLFETTELTLKTARSNRFQGNVLDTLYMLLTAVVHIQKFETEIAAEILAGIRIGAHPLVVYLAGFVEYGISRSLSTERQEQITGIFHRAKTAGMDWLALECAVLLHAANPTDVPLTDHIQRIQSEKGIHSLFSILEPESPWKTRLHALAYSLNSSSRQTLKAGSLRLVWFIRIESHQIELIPREQKFSISGNWLPGRIIPLKNLFGNPQLDYLTRQDQTILSSIQKIRLNARVFQYFFDWDQALPALVGHPLVFLADQPEFPIEVVRGVPKVLVETQDAVIRLTFSPKMSEQPIAVTRETSNRLSIVCLNPEQQRIARIIGEKGIHVPVSSAREVVEAISGLSSIITVHSDISGESASCIDIPSDPLPHVHLTACAAGFRVEIFVKPFPEGGLKLKPGEGAERIIGDVDGRSCRIRRDLSTELSNAENVVIDCPMLSRFPDVDWLWQITDPYDFLDTLMELNSLQQKCRIVMEWPEGEKLRLTREITSSDLRVKIRSRLSGFELSGQLVVDDAIMIELKELVAMLPHSHRRYVPIGEGQFLALTEALRNQLKSIAELTELRHRVLRFHPAAALSIDGLLEDIPHVETDEKWESHLRRIKSGRIRVPEIPKDLNATLRNYQIDGYTWLYRLSYWGVGACLADDMGLGKTVQVLAILLQRAPEGPSLVIAPASVCLNWLDEIQRFTPTLKPVRLDDRMREKTVQELQPFEVMVISYGLLMKEAELLASRVWETIVLDEAQEIKNIKAKRSQAAMALNGRFRIITTGTPVENHLGELHTLFNFINPGLLGSARHFYNTFADPIESGQDKSVLDRLKKIIQPFILRRMKSDVLSELPPLTEVMIHVDFYPAEASLYEVLRKNAVNMIETSRDKTGTEDPFRLFREIMKLRQACCHSRLIHPASRLPGAKLDVFENLVSDLLENHHKVLVFSQFVGYLTLIREVLDRREIRYCYLDGQTPLPERKQEIDAFQSGRGDVFLISLKAGGMGLNLTAADYVIHMDPWWNPAVESQAAGRAHRIGQQRPVTVYRLVVRHTIEEKIMALHEHKRNLAGTLLEGGDMSGRITAQELLELIQSEKKSGHPPLIEGDISA